MTPFALIPWDQPFLPALRQLILQRGALRPGSCVVLFPHDRPRRYLTALFRNDSSLPRPLLLPHMQTLREYTSLCRAYSEQTSLQTAGMLDRVTLLHTCVKHLGRDDPALSAHFSAMDLATFFPWGLRLAALLEEMFLHLVETRRLLYTEGEVSPAATALLESLGRIRDLYTQSLRERQWTTPGWDAWLAARNPENLPPRFLPTRTRHVFLAGFTVLTRAEEILLQYLWKRGATVCLHSDPALREHKAHWSCEDHQRWLRRWQARCELVIPPSGHTPRLFFTTGYDIHSQLAALRHILQRPVQEDMASSTAIVLPNVELLLPTLHHLPDTDVNISMGYPLAHASVCRLLDTIFRLQETRRPDGSYHWKELLQCLRHPYLKMLHPQQAAAPDQQRWTKLLRVLERHLRSGSPFVHPENLLTERNILPDPDLSPLLHQTLHILTENFAACRTPGDLATALARLCSLLLEYGHDALEHYPLDMESLLRLTQRIIPPLRDAEAAATPFPQGALFRLARQLIAVERVPFEADPLVGLQILGMLETRLLHFRRIFILDCVDDILPGTDPQDPLLPDALRPLLGLPGNNQRERVVAHTFFRLCAGADEAYFFWQEGVQRSPLFDGKKSRSRFVDELIWKEEQRRKKLLLPGEAPLTMTPCVITPLPRRRRSLPVTEALRKTLGKSRSVFWSPTALDSYLRCPLRFAFQYLCHLAPLEEVSEGDDPAAIGILLHTVLHTTYAPFLGKTLHTATLTPHDLEKTFEKSLLQSPLHKSLTPDGRIMLELAAKRTLRGYLEHQPASTHIVALEQQLHTDITTREHIVYHIAGTLDRVDQRENAFYVLDYKTGAIPSVDATLWEDDTFWSRLRTWQPTETGLGEALYQELAVRLPSVQLPAYMLLCTRKLHHTVRNAAWIPLKEDGKEHPLLPDTFDSTRLETLLSEDIPLLLGFLLRHMESQTAFLPQENKHCAWCPYMALCLH